MVTYHKGSILESRADAIINTVNCKGVMGAGIAKEVAKRYPHILKDYQASVAVGSFTPGTVLWYPTMESKPDWVICFATKDHWKASSQYRWITIGLSNLVWTFKNLQKSELAISSSAFPALGCGLGKLN